MSAWFRPGHFLSVQAQKLRYSSRHLMPSEPDCCLLCCAWYRYHTVCQAAASRFRCRDDLLLTCLLCFAGPLDMPVQDNPLPVLPVLTRTRTCRQTLRCSRHSFQALCQSDMVCFTSLPGWALMIFQPAVTRQISCCQPNTLAFVGVTFSLLHSACPSQPVIFSISHFDCRMSDR